MVNTYCTHAIISVTPHRLVGLQVTRDYDEEEQGYDSEKERMERKGSEESMSPHSEDNGPRMVKVVKVNGSDDHHEEDMDVSD